MTPAQLETEVLRCTRNDGSIGLASLCNTCHHEVRSQQYRNQPSWHRSRVERARKADNAAKLGRGRCECDGECGRLVTMENLSEFVWDHLIQSFDDPDYRPVSLLVSAGAKPERCDMERKKCRLLYNKCHLLHTAEQNRRR